MENGICWKKILMPFLNRRKEKCCEEKWNKKKKRILQGGEAMKKQAAAMLAALLCAAVSVGTIAAVPVSAEIKQKETITHVSVHDPSVLYGEDKNYYVFGSHQAAAKSSDLMEWKSFSNLYAQEASKELAESFAWAGYQDGSTNAKNGIALWAPCAVYNPYYKNSDGTQGSYMLYYPASSNFKRGCIGFAVSQVPDKEYRYVDTIMYSGFTKKGGKDEAQCKDTVDTNYERTNLSELIKAGTLSFQEDWLTEEGDYNIGSYPQAIDPTVFFDKDGQLWMCYGSHGGGIWLLPLDRTTGKPRFLTQEQIDAAEKNGQKADPYFGYKLTSAGEGPYLFYDDVSKYYYLTVSYGQITDGYNLRLFRSSTVNGIYEDAAGHNAVYGADLSQDNVGVKMIGNYQLEATSAYCMAGHNSMLNANGELFNIYHQRFVGKTSFSDRVHQMFRNEKGWLCTAVYEYAGDQISEKGYDRKELTGYYQFVNHGSISSGSQLTTYTVCLKEDGTVTGDLEGSWKASDGSCYMSLVINGVTYDGVFFKQKDESDERRSVMTFTAVGENNEAVWGSRIDEVSAEEAAKDAENPAYAYDFTTGDGYLTMNSGTLTAAGVLSGSAEITEDPLMGPSLLTKDENSFLKVSSDSFLGMTDGFSVTLWAKNEGVGTLFSTVSEKGSLTLTSDADKGKVTVLAESGSSTYELAEDIGKEAWNYIGLTLQKDSIGISLNGGELKELPADLSAFFEEKNLEKQEIRFGGGQTGIDHIAIYAVPLTTTDYVKKLDKNQAWTTEWMIDFGPEGSPQWDNFTMMYHTTLYQNSPMTQNYGFTEEIDAMESSAGGNKIRDFVYKKGGKPYTFQIDLPNGSYSVFVYSGNKMAENTLNFYFNEDKENVYTQKTPEGVASDNYGGQNTYEAEVVNEMLSITFWGDEMLGEDAVTGALNSLEIKKLDREEQPAKEEINLKKTKITGVSRIKKTGNYQVKWNKAAKAEGYIVQVSAKKSFQKIAYKTNTKKTSCVLKKKVVKGKQLYIRVRSYAENAQGERIYSKWSSKKIIS